MGKKFVLTSLVCVRQKNDSFDTSGSVTHKLVEAGGSGVKVGHTLTFCKRSQSLGFLS